MTVKLRNPGDTYGNCTVCGAYCVHHQHHTCPPTWRVTLEGDGDEGEVFALDAEAAAEAFCDQHDHDLEYTILRRGEAVLIVEGGGERFRVNIEAESRPHYSARIEYVEPIAAQDAAR